MHTHIKTHVTTIRRRHKHIFKQGRHSHTNAHIHTGANDYTHTFTHTFSLFNMLVPTACAENLSINHSRARAAFALAASACAHTSIIRSAA